MIRPEVSALFQRWQETIIAGCVTGLGIWMALQGGYLWLGLGGAVGLIGAGWAYVSFGHARFQQRPDGPGVVRFDEAELSYFSATRGGTVGLNALQEIKLVTIRGRRMWWLREITGEPLLVPVDAAGNDTLFNAFSTLPGLSQSDLLLALQGGGTGGLLSGAQPQILPVWRRPGKGLAEA